MDEKIRDYKELSNQQIILINSAKRLEKDIIDFISELQDYKGLNEDSKNGIDIGKRWLAIAKTDIEKGFMALVRSIARSD